MRSFCTYRNFICGWNGSGHNLTQVIHARSKQCSLDPRRPPLLIKGQTMTNQTLEKFRVLPIQPHGGHRHPPVWSHLILSGLNHTVRWPHLSVTFLLWTERCPNLKLEDNTTRIVRKHKKRHCTANTACYHTRDTRA